MPASTVKRASIISRAVRAFGRLQVDLIQHDAHKGLVTWSCCDRNAYGGFPKLPPIMENQMEKNLENEMETVFI